MAITLAVGGIGAAFGSGVAAVVAKNMLEAPSSLHMVALAEQALRARAAVLYDPQTGHVLYQKNANEPLALASLTKLMTAQAVLAAEPADTPVYITQDNLRSEGDSGLRPGETLRINDLIKLGLVSSSNDAIAAAAASLGDGYLTHMNDTAQRLGLTKTFFLNPTGLDLNASIAGAYGSAYDVARLAAAFYHAYPNYFEATSQEGALLGDPGRDLAAAATALPLFDIPGFIGGKTGYTDLAGGNLVAAFDLEVGRPVFAVVLGSTREGRFEDVRMLIAAARAQL